MKKLGLVIILLILCILGGAYTELQRMHALRLKNHHEAASAHHTASFEFTRWSHFGEKRRYSIDCPDASLCAVEIQVNDKPAAQTTVDWAMLEDFFNSRSAENFIVQPEPAVPGERILADWKFQLNNLSRAGSVTVKNLEQVGIGEWEALFLSFF